MLLHAEYYINFALFRYCIKTKKKENQMSRLLQDFSLFGRSSTKTKIIYIIARIRKKISTSDNLIFLIKIEKIINIAGSICQNNLAVAKLA
jgi:hypothetical protein